MWLMDRIVKSASFILLQGVPTHISLDAVRTTIKDVPGVISLHEVSFQGREGERHGKYGGYSIYQGKLISTIYLINTSPFSYIFGNYPNPPSSLPFMYSFPKITSIWKLPTGFEGLYMIRECIVVRFNRNSVMWRMMNL